MPPERRCPGQREGVAAMSIVHRESDHYPINTGGKEISARKDNNGHPHQRKIEPPVAHLPTLTF